MPKKNLKIKADQAEKAKTLVQKERELTEKILQKTHLGQYNTLDVVKYKEFLDSLSLTELQDEGFKRGLKPYGERWLVTDNLLQIFKEYARQFVPIPREPTLSKEKAAKLELAKKMVLAGR